MSPWWLKKKSSKSEERRHAAVCAGLCDSKNWFSSTSRACREWEDESDSLSNGSLFQCFPLDFRPKLAECLKTTDSSWCELDSVKHVWFFQADPTGEHVLPSHLCFLTVQLASADESLFLCTGSHLALIALYSFVSLILDAEFWKCFCFVRWSNLHPTLPKGGAVPRFCSSLPKSKLPY